MIYAFDTYYSADTAKTVCIGFDDWQSDHYIFCKSERLPVNSEYISGQFYKRELPCILSILHSINLQPTDIVVIDGFVFLNDEEKPGLGAHLYEAIQRQTPVIGVAKSNFATLELQKRAISRGESKKPLFITAIGLNLDQAAAHIKSMTGSYRLPDLLKQLDLLTKAASD